jgi:hypothetical protein
MKIAYIILAHKNPDQIQRLVSRLGADHSDIFIHVDLGAQAEIYSAMQQLLAGCSSIHWLPRFHSHWGSWGLVQASLSGLEEALQVDCDYALLLSGQDYPIKPGLCLVNFLEEQLGTSYLQYHQLPSTLWPPDGSSRYTRWHFNLGWKDSAVRKLTNRVLNRAFNTLVPNRTLPDGLAPFGGWQWWCLHRDCINYVLEFTVTHRKTVEFFKHVRIPDEMYIHTLLMNSPLRPSIQNCLLTFTDWQGPPYPRILNQSDFEKLKNSELFFARKFDSVVDEEILDRIDRELLHL